MSEGRDTYKGRADVVAGNESCASKDERDLVVPVAEKRDEGWK